MLGTASLLAAAETQPYETDFEATEGYAPGPLMDGTWLHGPQAPLVTDADSASGQQSLVIPGAAGQTGTWMDFEPMGPGVTFVDFFLKPVAGPLASLPVESAEPLALWTGFVETGGVGAIYATDGDGQGGGSWLSSGITRPLSGSSATDWIRYTYRLDYDKGQYDLFLDGSLILVDLGFLDSSVTSLDRFHVQAGSPGDAYLDFFYIGPSNPLFVDADRDAIPTDYELAQGLNPNADDRAGDLDFDLLSNLDEYFSGLGAGNPDSDGDGRPDGLERLLGSDPAVAESFTLAPLPFAEDFESYPPGSLNGYGIWAASGIQSVPEVQSDTVHQGNRALRLNGSGSRLHAEGRFAGVGVNPVWIDFFLKPALHGEADLPVPDSHSAVVFFFNAEGVPVVFDGNGLGGGSWHTLGEAPSVDSPDWTRMTVRSDYPSQSWSLWVGGVRQAAGLGFAAPSPYLHRFLLTQSFSANSYVDALTISATEPAGLDNDGDGLINTHEDVNGNDLVDFGETDPEQTDTDGDGFSDVAGVHLQLWLRADAGVATDAQGRVAAWTDQSLNQDDAVQADTARQPLLITDAIGGQPAVRFDGADDFLEGAGAWDPGAGDYTLVVVHRREGPEGKSSPISYATSLEADGAPLLKWGKHDQGKGDHLGVNNVGIDGNQGLFLDLGPSLENGWTLTSLSRQGGSQGLDGVLRLRVSGGGQTLDGNAVQDWMSGASSGYFIGKKRIDNSVHFQGEIAEVLVYSGALTGEDLQALEDRLAETYGIDLDHDGDGLPDSWETAHFADLQASDGQDDPDQDQVSTFREFHLGTDPNAFDAFNPILTHPHLKLWLDAETGLETDSDGKLQRWLDQSGYGGHAEQPDA
ncbi:MAG: hypothetical protein ACFE0O_07750, partial [Opitutales bacterium]